MFIDDIKNLRAFIIENLRLSMLKAKDAEDLRAQERTYFMGELEKDEKIKDTLEKRINSLKETLVDEKRYNTKLFVRENVT